MDNTKPVVEHLVIYQHSDDIQPHMDSFMADDRVLRKSCKHYHKMEYEDFGVRMVYRYHKVTGMTGAYKLAGIRVQGLFFLDGAYSSNVVNYLLCRVITPRGLQEQINTAMEEYYANRLKDNTCKFNCITDL